MWLRYSIDTIAVGMLICLTGANSLFAQNLVDHFVNNDPNQGHGPVITTPGVFITYWGSDWANGFNDPISGQPSTAYRTYLETAIQGMVGGIFRDWLSTQSQYRNAGGQTGSLKGTWIDSNDPQNTTPTNVDIYNEVRKSYTHFIGGTLPSNWNSNGFPNPFDVNNIFIIAVAPGNGDKNFVAKGGPNCAWHSAVNYLPFVFLPYEPEALSCGHFKLLQWPGDSFGHGAFDGVSIVVGHEVAEAVTDPHLDAWYGISGTDAETGDKCNWKNISNLKLGGHYYAMQPLWSNQDSKCIFGSVGPIGILSPSDHDFGHIQRQKFNPPLTVTVTNAGDRDMPLYTTTNWLLNAQSVWFANGSAADLLNYELANDTCPTVLHPGDSCQIQVRFRAQDAQVIHQVALGIVYNDGGTLNGGVVAKNMNLSGIGDLPIAVPVNVDSENQFTNVLVGTAVNGIVTVHNEGSSEQSVASVQIGGPSPFDFSILEGNCPGRPLPPGESCQELVLFRPSRTGERLADIEVAIRSSSLPSAEAVDTIFSSPLFGIGQGPVAELSTTSLSSFEGISRERAGEGHTEIQVIGDTEGTVTLTNSGRAPLSVSEVRVTGDFALAENDCAQPLGSKESCTIKVRLKTGHYQLQSGSLIIVDNTSDSPHEITLEGKVEGANTQLAPEVLQFGTVPVWTTSPPQQVELNNVEGDVALQIDSIATTGDFLATSDCPTPLLIGRCHITVTLKPSAAGSQQGKLIVSTNAPDSPREVTLLGTACVPGDITCRGTGDGGDPAERRNQLD